MGNKYQPSSQTIYLDPSELDDKEHFNRGYTYQVGYTLTFIEEEGKETIYQNEFLETSDNLQNVPANKNSAIVIDRQDPIYTQYISTSNSESITYRYSFTDIDNAIKNNKFYYSLGDSNDNNDTNKTINTDGTYHEVTFPFSNNTNYTIKYSRKNAKENKDLYVEFNSYNFEKEIKYNNELSYEIINNYNNNLTIKLEENNFTKRAAAYKVILKADGVSDYIRYFLASKLDTIEESTGETDEEGNEITKNNKIIAIDYANISRFMKKNIKVSVYSYYDNGLVGFDQSFENGMILNNHKTNKYLNIHNTGFSNNRSLKVSISEDNDTRGIYKLKSEHKITDASIGLYNKLTGTKDYNNAGYEDYEDSSSTFTGVDFELAYTNEGAVLTYNKKDYRGYNVRLLGEANLKAEDNTYRFDEIVPTINVTTNNTINSIKVNITPSGIYGNDQFKKDNTEHNKIYIDFYSDEELTNKLTSTPLTTDIHINGNDDTGYTATIDSLEYNNNLTPNTTYYFTVYAYINNKYTRLYDSSSKGKYNVKTYIGKTLGAKEILKSISFTVAPDSYSGETSRKKLSWNLNLNNTENYKLRFELFKPDGENYKQVNFDGTDATACNINNTGNSSNGYVNGCYISVPVSEISTIKSKDQNYYFTGNDFVFGDGYYKLVVYAIPYYQNSYKEDQKITLYENDSLTTMNGISNTDGVNQTIKILELAEANLRADNIDSGYECTDTTNNDCSDGHYYVSFKTDITDNSYVMKYGKYQAILRDSSRNIVGSGSANNCQYYDNGILKTADECSITLDANSLNKELKFINLNPNSRYYIELTYDTYRNNVGYTEIKKTEITPFTDSIFTPPPNDIKTLGYISAYALSNKQIRLTHNAYSESIIFKNPDAVINNKTITIVDYTITLMGGSNAVNGTISINDTNPSIFTINPDKSLSMTIDVSQTSDNPNYTFKSGNKYLVTTQYYYDNNNTDDSQFKDDLFGKIDKFTSEFSYN